MSSARMETPVADKEDRHPCSRSQKEKDEDAKRHAAWRELAPLIAGTAALVSGFVSLGNCSAIPSLPAYLITAGLLILVRPSLTLAYRLPNDYIDYNKLYKERAVTKIINTLSLPTHIFLAGWGFGVTVDSAGNVFDQAFWEQLECTPAAFNYAFGATIVYMPSKMIDMISFFHHVSSGYDWEDRRAVAAVAPEPTCETEPQQEGQTTEVRTL